MKTVIQKPPKRIVLYPSDVSRMTGRTDCTARRMLNKVRRSLGKSPRGIVTVKEFCDYYNIDKKVIDDFLDF